MNGDALSTAPIAGAAFVAVPQRPPSAIAERTARLVRESRTSRPTRP